ncbi:unnamed protein product, partial [Discosporangium mesarthrocarpum]
DCYVRKTLDGEGSGDWRPTLRVEHESEAPLATQVIDLLAKFKAVGEAVPSLEAQLEGDTI